MKRTPLRRKKALRPKVWMARAPSSFSMEELRAAHERPFPPLKPRKRLPAKRATPRRSSRVRDEAYLSWVRLQPCMVGERAFVEVMTEAARLGIAHGIRIEGGARCSGPTDPDHRREGVGAGQKASDRDAWPCCRRHHDDRHALTGVFAGWDREAMREFIRARISEANARYERHLSNGGPL